MKYGHFDDAAREYVIDRPDTPRPWSNYIGSRRLSGTASWACYTAAQWLLCIRPEVEGLRIDPCIPAAWAGFEAVREFRGATYTISVKNPRHVCRGVRQLKVDGRLIEGAVIPPAAAGQMVQVEAELG